MVPHVMNRERVEGGREEWYCPECGRFLIVRWEPAFEKTTLINGDPEAMHVGNTTTDRIEKL